MNDYVVMVEYIHVACLFYANSIRVKIKMRISAQWQSVTGYGKWQ